MLLSRVGSLPPAGVFKDGTTSITHDALPYRLTSHTVTLKFDSLEGLAAAPDEVNGELVSTLATTVLSFSVTDPDGGTLDANLLLRVYRQEPSCLQPRHEIVVEGEAFACKPCEANRATSKRSPTCDICNEGYFRLSAEHAASSCVRCSRGACLFAVSRL